MIKTCGKNTKKRDNMIRKQPIHFKLKNIFVTVTPLQPPEVFYNKIAGFRSATLLKKRLSHRYFPVNFAKCLRTPFYRTPPDDCFYYIQFLKNFNAPFPSLYSFRKPLGVFQIFFMKYFKRIQFLSHNNTKTHIVNSPHLHHDTKFNPHSQP